MKPVNTGNSPLCFSKNSCFWLYTGTILNELVKALRELHCTIIILSATLTDKQRSSVLGASPDLDREKPPTPYPLISVFTKEGTLREIETARLEDAKVDVHISPNDDEAANEVLLRAERGEQILWVENSLPRASGGVSKKPKTSNKKLTVPLYVYSSSHTPRHKQSSFYFLSSKTAIY